jgi:hypothetical protein
MKLNNFNLFSFFFQKSLEFKNLYPIFDLSKGINNNLKTNEMTTATELQALENQVNELLRSAKNVVKMNKALKIANEALENQKTFINNISDWALLDEKMEDANFVYDIQYDIEQLIKSIEYDIRTRNWNGQDFAFASLCASNID